MLTIRLTLDKKRVQRLNRWALSKQVTRSEIIRSMIDGADPIFEDRAARIMTTDDLIKWAEKRAGKGLGLAQNEAQVPDTLSDELSEDQ